MKIIIDIPEEDYKKLTKTEEGGDMEIPLNLLFNLWDYMRSGEILTGEGANTLWADTGDSAMTYLAKK